jgi:ABC-type branched-subunit amino acid transport system permease subunit
MAEVIRVTFGQSYAGIHLVVYGAVLMGVILFAPDGLMGFIRSLRLQRAVAARVRSQEAAP